MVQTRSLLSKYRTLIPQTLMTATIVTGRVRGVYRLERPQHVELGTASRFTVPRGEGVQSMHHEHKFGT